VHILLAMQKARRHLNTTTMTKRCDPFHSSINSLLESAEEAANGADSDKRLKRNLLQWSLLSKT
jgi:hypothetical protein